MIIVVTFEGNTVELWTDDGLVERHTIQERHINELYYSMIGAFAGEIATTKAAEKRGEAR